MWCYVVLFGKSARTSKQIYVSHTTQNVTSGGKIWVKYCILSSLSLRSLKRGRFMLLVLVRPYVCVCVCVWWGGVSYCTRQLDKHHSVQAIQPKLAGSIVIDGGQRSVQIKTDRTKHTWTKHNTLKHLNYPGCTSPIHSHSPALYRSLCCQIVSPCFQFAISSHHLSRSKGRKRLEWSPSKWQSNLQMACIHHSIPDVEKRKQHSLSQYISV